MYLDQLREAYRSTWLEWARRTDALQQSLDHGNPDQTRLEGLLRAVEESRAAHNEARDLLARALGHLPEPVSAADGSDGRVRTTARLLRDLSGRPAGTAESDWTRARSMVRTATAR